MTSYRLSDPLRRVVRRSAATRGLAWLYGHIQQPIDLLVHRLFRGRTTLTGLLADVQIVMLATTGARTGQQRVAPVMAVPDGDAVVVLASNFGRPRHPAWYHNLKASPRAIVTGGVATWSVRPRELWGAERDQAFHRAVEIYPGFEHYQRWAAPRTIPVIRLERAE